MKFIKDHAALLLAIMVVAALAAFAATQKVDPDGSAFPRYFKSGLYIGPTNPNPTNDTRNRLTSFYSDFQSWDFPALTGYTANGQACQDSASFTKQGLRFGDGCDVGVDQALISNVVVFPVITAANTYKLTACSIGISDAGQPNQPDSGYTLYCVGNLAR